MLVLELVGLLIAFCASLFAIWSNPNRKTRTATIATLIAVVGVVAGISLSVWKSRKATRSATATEQRRQEDLRTQLAQTALNSIEITWTLPSVPESIRKVLIMSDLLISRNFLRDDEWDRMPVETKRKIADAWNLETGIRPLLTCIAEGRENLDQLYQGEGFDDAIRRFESDPDRWIDDIGTNIEYVGSSYELLFPLNVALNAVLSLGKPEDDVVSTTRSVADEEDPALFDLTNYAFKATAELYGQGFRIRWNYGPESLRRAAVRHTGIPITGGFPRRFSFVIVHRKMEKCEYLKVAREFVTPNEREAEPTQKPWYYRSELQIIVNDLQDRKYIFDVKRAGDTQMYTDPGAYDSP